VKDEGNYLAIPVDKVKEIMEMNKNKIFPEKLEDFAFKMEQKVEEIEYINDDDLSRFDKDYDE